MTDIVVPQLPAAATAGKEYTIITASNQAVISFTTIPSTYQHARLTIVGRDNDPNSESLIMRIRFNGDSVAANYVKSQNCGFLPGSRNNPNALGVSMLDLPGYSQTKFPKAFLGRGGFAAGAAGVIGWQGSELEVGWWQSLAAITQIELLAVTSFYNGTVATLELYG